MHRTELLRERTLQRQQRITGRHRLHPEVDAASLKNTEGISSWQARTGVRVRDRLAALDGLQVMIQHAADTVERALIKATGPRRVELGEILSSCLRIAHSKPMTFRDAIQLLWFVMLGHMSGDMVWLVGPGRLDRVLLPFHRAEDSELELELIEALYLVRAQTAAKHFHRGLPDLGTGYRRRRRPIQLGGVFVCRRGQPGGFAGSHSEDGF